HKVREAHKCEKEARQFSDEYEDNEMTNKEGIEIIYQDDKAEIESEEEEEE
ncbi:2824_t:CDS:2, partial [Gigaspora margarita]